jgi:hypothetical protein
LGIPYPSALLVNLGGVDLPRFEDIPSGTSPTVTGFYKVVDVDPNPNPALWTLAIRPPDNQLGTPSYALKISDVSINPKFRDANGKNQVSTPLSIVAVRQKIFSLTILMPGTGRGRVTGGVPGQAQTINCEANCTIDFPPGPVVVQLFPSSSKNSSNQPTSRFAGWSGACTGMGQTCAPLLNGTAVAVGVTFDSLPGAPPEPSGCPGPTNVPGFVFWNTPLCSGQNVFNDPSPTPRCDAQGYFCCAHQNGTNDPRCGTDQHSFPANCMFGNTNIKMEPSGCYLKN